MFGLAVVLRAKEEGAKAKLPSPPSLGLVCFVFLDFDLVGWPASFVWW